MAAQAVNSSIDDAVCTRSSIITSLAHDIYIYLFHLLSLNDSESQPHTRSATEGGREVFRREEKRREIHKEIVTRKHSAPTRTCMRIHTIAHFLRTTRIHTHRSPESWTAAPAGQHGGGVSLKVSMRTSSNTSSPPNTLKHSATIASFATLSSVSVFASGKVFCSRQRRRTKRDVCVREFAED